MQSPLHPLRFDDWAVRSKFYRDLIMLLTLGTVFYAAMWQHRIFGAIAATFAVFCALMVLARWAHAIYLAVLRLIIRRPATALLLAAPGAASGLYFGLQIHDTTPYLAIAAFSCLAMAARFVVWVSHPKRNAALEAARDMY